MSQTFLPIVPMMAELYHNACIIAQQEVIEHPTFVFDPTISFVEQEVQQLFATSRELWVMSSGLSNSAVEALRNIDVQNKYEMLPGFPQHLAVQAEQIFLNLKPHYLRADLPLLTPRIAQLTNRNVNGRPLGQPWHGFQANINISHQQIIDFEWSTRGLQIHRGRWAPTPQDSGKFSATRGNKPPGVAGNEWMRAVNRADSRSHVHGTAYRRARRTDGTMRQYAIEDLKAEKKRINNVEESLLDEDFVDWDP